MTDFRWAIVGPGRIAHRFADAVFQMPGTHLRAVLGRGSGSADPFVAHWTRPGKPAPHVIADLRSLLDDDAIDGVYVATPHSAHFPFVKACLEAGKPVLCEKPLVPTRAQADELVEISRGRHVFLMEAFWTRLLPIYARVGAWLRSGAIGRVTGIQSSFCGPVPYDPAGRHFNASLAGGALLDIGIYCLGMTRWALETALRACPPPISVRAEGVLAPTGVDRRVAATLVFPEGVLAQFICGFDGSADNSLRIHGTEGCISVPQRFWEATQAILSRRDAPPETVEAPFRVNGFEYEAEEAMRCIRAGLVESPLVPHTVTLDNLALLDELRRQLGVRYPFEQDGFTR